MFRNLAFGLLLCLSLGVPAMALGDTEGFAVEVDKAKVMRLPRAASAVIVGNPAIADATVHDGRLLLITGKIYGATNIIVLDARGNTIVERDIQVSSPQVAAITYYRGGAQRSYTCAGRCEATPNIGDDPEVFEQLMDQQEGKTDQGSDTVTEE